MDEQKRVLKSGIAKRARRVYLGFVLVVLLFIFRLAYIQISPTVGAHLDSMLADFVIKSVEVKAQRGTVYSRDGKILATSITRKSLWVDFGSEALKDRKEFLTDARELSYNLADYFGDRSADAYYSDFVKYHNASYRYERRSKEIKPSWWKFWQDTEIKEWDKVVFHRNVTKKVFRDVDQNEWQEIRKFPIFKRGVNITYSADDKDYRIYPQGEIALRTLGRNDPETGRRYGIEAAFNDTLTGKDGVQYVQHLASGRRPRISHRGNVEVQHGYDIVTTLDVDVQDVADKALRNQITKRRADWGTTIVMECATGDILAIANIGRNSNGELYERQNYAIGVPVNPGSTFKLVSAMALLENNVPTSRKYNSGLGKTVVIASAKIRDSHPIAKETGGVIDMHRAFTESANVYFAQAVHDTFYDNPQKFSDFCRELYLDKCVGLEYLGARKGTIPHLDRKHPSRYNALTNMAIGYNVDVTPLHTLTLYNAIANGGRMVAPRLIQRIERNGECVQEFKTKVLKEQICSKKTVDTLRSFMESVSLRGTAAAYFSEKNCLFRSGAKTGTASVKSMINGKLYTAADRYYYGTMVTYFPADNPRYTIITSIFCKNHGDEMYYGATLAGPVQQKVATFLYNRDKEYAEELSSEKHFANDIKGGLVENMREVAGEYSERYTSSGRDGWGTSSVDKKNRVVISQIEVAEGRVPDVVGMGLDDALYLLERCGLVVEIEGEGRVVRQSIAAGSVVEKGKRVKIVLK